MSAASSRAGRPALAAALCCLACGGAAAQEAAPAATAVPVATAAASAVLVLRDDLETAVEEARRDGRRLALFFRANWSPWAVAMEQKVLTDPRVAEVLKSLILLRIDGGRQPELAERFEVVDFPVLVLLEPGGREIGRIHGYASADQLVARLPGLLSEVAAATTPVPTGDPESELEALDRQIAERRRRGDLRGAAAAARRLIDLDAENAAGRTDNALAFLGLLEQRQGNWSRAFRIYVRVLELDDDPPTELRSHALVAGGYSASMAGLRAEAIRAYEQFLKEFPRHEDVSFVRGELQRLRRLAAQGLGG